MRPDPALRSPRATLALAICGALGAVARLAVSFWLADSTASVGAFPVATLVVNTLGAFGIGAIASLSAPGGRWPLGPVARQALMAGVFGGFTTFSIFSLEALMLAQSGHNGTAAAYVLISVALWLAAARLGLRCGAS